MSEITYIKPCPFCGGKAKEGHRDRCKYDVTECVYCPDCWVKTDYCKSIHTAVYAWNKRVCACAK